MSIFNSLGSNYSWRDLGHLINGFDYQAPQLLVRELEKHYHRQATLTYKGREALCAILKELDLPSGALVAINGYTCYAVYDAVISADLQPVYVDIAKDSLHFDYTGLKKAAKAHDIKAVIVQNTLGVPVDIVMLEELCHKNKLVLIEDLAHSIGMVYHDGREAGEVGDYAALSFSQDKVVDAVSGGAILSRKPLSFKGKKLNYFRFLKDYYYIPNTLIIRNLYSLGFGRAYNFILKRLHWLPRPMDGDADDFRQPDVWHSALARKQFSSLGDSLQHRQRIARVYHNELPEHVQFSFDQQAIYLRFPIKIENREGLIRHLKKADIHIADIWYESVVSPARMLGKTNYQTGTCPRAEEVAEQMVNLPTHAQVSVDDATRIAEEVSLWLSRVE